MSVAIAGVALLALLGASPSAGAAPQDDCMTDATLVRGAPAFDSFRVRPRPGKRVAPQLNNRTARLFRTQLRQQAAQGPNFAGRYTVAQWGCGSGCVDFAIVDARTGKVFETRFGDISVSNTLKEPLAIQQNSTLMVLVGAPNEDEARDGVHFLHWTGAELKELRFVPRARACRPAPPS